MINLSIQNVSKSYPGNVMAVKNFSMDVNKGEFIVFVGPSGCGKSTMLRMIAGLETISGGDVLLNGKRINDKAPADRDIAMVFQNYALFGTMSVYENMGLPLAIRHVNGDEIHLKIMEAAETVEMKHELNRRPSQLSGGQRQRVAIGRSLVRHPEIFLMDEPLSNLDAKLRTQTRKELSTLQNRLGITFIYVTHDQVEAMTLADRIVIMNEGAVQQIGTPKDVYLNPANTFVGGFIGSPPMNFIKGVYQDGRFVSDAFSISVPENRQAVLNGYEDKSIIAGVRPEHFYPAKNGNGDIETRAEIAECLGNEYIIYFHIKDKLCQIRLSAEHSDIRTGDRMSLCIDSAKISFFDPDTGQRICQESGR